MATSASKSGTAIMRPRARLISLIGEELISDEPVAVVELVKNAYDADARDVTVEFEGNPDSPTRIIIKDNGHGMDLDTVLNAWLEPGTIAKKRAEHSPNGRTYQGAKGIGRFASARLGRTLMMETTKLGVPNSIIVIMSWGRFDDDSFLDEISVEYEVRDAPPEECGTRLTIEQLPADRWGEEQYEQLHARLSRLISPFNEVEDFKITLEIPGHAEWSGKVETPDLVAHPKYWLNGNIDSEGFLSGEIAIEGRGVQKLSALQIASKGRRPICGPFRVEIRAWDRDREGLEPIAARESLSIAQVRKTLNTYCGVSIYRDGFRVHPYGETGNDWLSLDLRSRQNPVRNLANNQIIAAIRISRSENPQLQDRSTREGMIKNLEHSDLEEWFKQVLTKLEEKRYEVRPRQEKADTSEPLFEPFDVSDTVKQVRATLGVEHPITRLVEEAKKQIGDGVERVQEVYSRILMSAGVGHMVDIVLHEIGSPLGKINRELSILEKTLKDLLDEDDIEIVEQSIKAMKIWIEQIFNLRGRLEPQKPGRRGRATSFDVLEEINLNVELFNTPIEKQKIKCKITAPKAPIKVRMSRSSLGQIIANLLDNAIYWIEHTHGSGRGGNLHIALKALPKGFAISISDSGPGISAELRERVFEPYYSSKPNGIGLGLYIARLVIEPYGRLILSDKGTLDGACFEAQFEKGVGL